MEKTDSGGDSEVESANQVATVGSKQWTVGCKSAKIKILNSKMVLWRGCAVRERSQLATPKLVERRREGWQKNEDGRQKPESSKTNYKIQALNSKRAGPGKRFRPLFHTFKASRSQFATLNPDPVQRVHLHGKCTR